MTPTPMHDYDGTLWDDDAGAARLGAGAARRSMRAAGHGQGAARRASTGWGVLWIAMVLTFVVGPAEAQILPSFGKDRAGTSGFQFLKIPVDARSAALGETAVATAFDASALFWNPALAAQTDGLQLGFSHTAYLADISMQYVAASVPLGRYGLTLGGHVQALDAGEMDVTTEFEPFGTGETFRFVDLAAGLSVAQRLTDLFSYGLTAKYLRESVAGVAANSVVFDLGVFYRIGTTGAQMAVAIRNFGPDGRPTGELPRLVLDDAGTVVEDDFESFPPPTTFLLGASYRLLRQAAQHDVLVAGQLTNPNDNAETLNVGVEYTWNDLLALRTGYRFGVDEFSTPSFGVGLRLPELGGLGARFDYGFSRRSRLGTVHRVGLNLSL